MSRSYVINVRDVHISFNGVKALDSVNLELQGPGIVQILGPNGAGKSTLLRLIAGLLKPSKGSVYINGVDVTGRYDVANRFVAYMPQSNEPPQESPLTVWEFVETSLLARRTSWPRFRAGRFKEIVGECLNTVGLPERTWSLRLSELSGGMFQRVLIAGVLVTRTPIILLDEPLASIDPEGRVSLSKLLAGLASDRLVIVTSHDPHPLLDHTNILVLLNKSVIAVGEPHSVLSRYSPAILYPLWVSDHGH